MTKILADLNKVRSIEQAKRFCLIVQNCERAVHSRKRPRQTCNGDLARPFWCSFYSDLLGLFETVNVSIWVDVKRPPGRHMKRKIDNNLVLSVCCVFLCWACRWSRETCSGKLANTTVHLRTCDSYFGAPFWCAIEDWLLHGAHVCCMGLPFHAEHASVTYTLVSATAFC